MYGQTRPYPFRPCWEFAPKDLQQSAEPLARMLNRLPARYLALATQVIDPALAIIGMYAIVGEASRREREVEAGIARAVAEGTIDRDAADRALGRTAKPVPGGAPGEGGANGGGGAPPADAGPGGPPSSHVPVKD